MKPKVFVSTWAVLLFCLHVQGQNTKPAATFAALQKKAKFYRDRYNYSLAIQYDSLSFLQAQLSHDALPLQQAANDLANDYLDNGQFSLAEGTLDQNKDLFAAQATAEACRWYQLKGNCRFKQIDFGNALAAYRTAAAAAGAIGDSTRIHYLNMLIGKTLIYHGKSDSISLAYDALDYFDKTKNFRYAAQATLAISFAFQQAFNLEKAQEYNTKALGYGRQSKDEGLQAEAKVRMSDIFISQKNYGDALSFAAAAQQFYRTRHLLTGLASAGLRLGRIYTETDKYDLAEKEFAGVEKLNTVLNMSAIKLGLGGYRYLLQAKMKNFKAADSLAAASMELASKVVDKRLINTVLTKARQGKAFGEEDLHQADSILNGKRKAFVVNGPKAKPVQSLSDSDMQQLSSLNQFTGADASNDSTLLAATNRQLLAIDAQFRTSEYSDSLQQTKEESKRTHEDLNQRNKFLFITAALLVVVSLSLWLQYKNRRRAERDKVRIELLQNEIHHRVKNNLAVINRLVDVAGKGSLHDASLDGLKTRIKSIELLHRHLYSEEAAAGNIALQPYFDDLCAAIAATFASSKDIRISVEADAVVDSTVAEKLGLIINELVTNSFKYAFANKDEGSIAVRAWRTITALNVTVKDDGIGLPEGKAKANYGLKLIKGLSHELNGKFSFEGHHGTTFQLSIPT